MYELFSLIFILIKKIIEYYNNSYKNKYYSNLYPNYYKIIFLLTFICIDNNKSGIKLYPEDIDVLTLFEKNNNNIIILTTERKDNKKRIFVTFVLYNHKFSSFINNTTLIVWFGLYPTFLKRRSTSMLCTQPAPSSWAPSPRSQL